MYRKWSIFVLGGLAVGSIFTASTAIFCYIKHYQKDNSNIMVIEKKKYLEMMDTIITTRNELESIMKNIVANGNNSLIIDDKLYESLKLIIENLKKYSIAPESILSDIEDYETPPSTSMEVLNNEDLMLNDSNTIEWLYINDGYHCQKYYKLWKFNIEKNFSLDYYESCARKYAQSPIRLRTLRTKMLNLNDDVDYIIKVIAIRDALNLLLDNLSNFNWFIDTLRYCFVQILEIAQKPTSQFNSTFDELLSFILNTKNSKIIEEELSSENIGEINAYDIVIDFMILDSLADLDCLPSAILSVTKSRFITRSLRENAFCTLVWSYIQSKVKRLKYPNGFLAKYYSVCHTISPVLAWGFLGDTGPLNDACNSFKNTFMKFIINIFNEKKIFYENKFDFADGILKSAKKSFKKLSKHFETLKISQSDCY